MQLHWCLILIHINTHEHLALEAIAVTNIHRRRRPDRRDRRCRSRRLDAALGLERTRTLAAAAPGEVKNTDCGPAGEVGPPRRAASERWTAPRAAETRRTISLCSCHPFTKLPPVAVGCGRLLGVRPVGWTERQRGQARGLDGEVA